MQFETKNIIFSGKLSRPVSIADLRPLLASLGQIKENRLRTRLCFRCVAYPKCSFVLFSSDEFVAAGFKTQSAFADACDFLANELRQIWPSIAILQTRVENWVVRCTVDANFNLQAIANALQDATYDSVKFPGMIIPIPGSIEGQSVVFSSGQCILTGLKDIEHYRQLFSPLVAQMRDAGEIQVPDHTTLNKTRTAD